MESNYIIYIIQSDDVNNKSCYIGSTKDFKGRKHHHKKCCIDANDAGYNRRLYKFFRENGGWDNFDMRPIEELNHKTKLQARIREQYWIDYYKSDLNCVNAYRTEAQKAEQINEYYLTNKDEINEKKQAYRENNKNKIKEQSRAYRENNKEKIKLNRELNRDTFNEKQRLKRELLKTK